MNLNENCLSNSTLKFPYKFSLNNQNQNKNKEKSIEVKIIILVTNDNMLFFINEMRARKKIYYGSDFSLTLADNLDLKYVKSLSTKDRSKYLSDPVILN